MINKVIRTILYFFFLVFFLLILAAGAGYFVLNGGKETFGASSDTPFYKAKITETADPVDTVLDEDGTMIDTTYAFTAVFTSGPMKGQSVFATQVISNYAIQNPRPVSLGDKVILYKSYTGENSENLPWSFAEYVRTDAVIVLAVLFCVALVVFGLFKGLKTLYTLVLTVSSVFFVLVPAIFTGKNIYLWTIIICLYITAMTLIIVNGLSKMSLVGGLGCMGGVLISAFIYLIMDHFLKLTGYTDECTIYLKGINNGVIDLKALVFAGILVGSIGAVMDVAVNIAASLHEVAAKIEKPSFGELYKSGITISRDIIGTMSNTLILAYIGSSLCSVLLIVYNNSFSLINLFNKENIIIEILKILIGSFGILSALPLTSLISALFYRYSDKKKKAASDETDEYVEILNRANEEK